MIWRELLLEQAVDDQRLLEALAELFAVSQSSVRIVDDLMAAPKHERATLAVTVERRRLQGDAEPNDLHLLKLMAERLESSILTDDEGPDPSAMLRVSPNGQVSRVVPDDELLDESGRVAILSPRARENSTPAAPIA